MSSMCPRVIRPSRLDWVKFDAELARDGSVEPVDKALYAALASFVDPEDRDSPHTPDAGPDDDGVPTRKKLAACIGRSVDTVDRATSRLEARGLVRVERKKDPENPKRNIPSVYELLDYVRWDERAADRAAKRAARNAGEGGGRMDAARGSRTGAARGGRMDAAVKDLREAKEEKDGESAPTARSAPDGRRPSTGSSGHATGGSAASGKSRHRLSKAEYEAIRAVRDLLPVDLEKALPAKTPTNLGAAILEGLAVGAPFERTAAQLVEFRLMPRWNGYWAAKLYAGELSSAVGPMLAMLAHRPECSDISCEDRVNIHSGGPCAACEARREDRRADTGWLPAAEPAAGVPAQRPTVTVDHVAVFGECADDMCGRPLPRGQETGLCHLCSGEQVPS